MEKRNRIAEAEDSTLLGDMTEPKAAEEQLRGPAEGTTHPTWAEQAVKQQLHFLQTLIDRIPVSIFYKDMDGRYQGCNASFESYIGRCKAEIIGRTIHEIAPKDVADVCREADLALFHNESGVQQYVASVVYADGTRHDVVFHTSTFKDLAGQVAGLVGAIFDITELKTAERELLNLHRKHQMILDSAAIGILGLDPRGKILFANPFGAAMVGYTPAELVGSDIDLLLHHAVPEDAPYPTGDCPLLEILTTVDSCCRGYTVFWRKDGTSFPAVYSAAPIIEHGETKGVVLTFRDITDLRLAEEEKNRLQSHLQRAQKLEAIGTLAGGITHDFANIVSIIMGYAGLAKSEVSENEKARRYLEEVLSACSRARDLITQILSFSHADEKLERQHLDMRPIVKEVTKFLKATLPSTIEIQQTISSQNGTILAHATQIHQILTNLCTNAAHAMEETGGILEVSLTDVDLCPPTLPPHSDLKPGPYVRLTVADTGYGMDAATLERIFDPYFTTKAVGKGSGLGLAVVHGIVNGHEGAITVSSEAGKGTTFHVYLPRIERRLMSPGKLSSSIPGGSERILFVDDEALLADIWQKTLEPLGYEVIVRTSSTEAFELFRAHPEYFDLVITDYVMPHMTGIDLAKQMMRLRPETPVILCTGWRDRTTEEKIKESGFRAFLIKPLELCAVAETIRKVLDENKPTRTGEP